MTRRAVTIDLIKKFAIFFAKGGANMSWFDLLYPDPDGKRVGSNGEAFDVFNTKYSLYCPKHRRGLLQHGQRDLHQEVR